MTIEYAAARARLGRGRRSEGKVRAALAEADQAGVDGVAQKAVALRAVVDAGSVAEIASAMGVIVDERAAIRQELARVAADQARNAAAKARTDAFAKAVGA